jgi:hypothetical protein
MMKRLSSILFFFVASLLAARAGEKVEAALYLGENGPISLLGRPAPPELSDRLHQVFGFNHYQLMRKGRIELGHPWIQWFVPRRDFFISVRPVPPETGEPQLVDYEIYQGGFLVARGKYEPREDTPLFINGPDFKNGRLIFVLVTR